MPTRHELPPRRGPTERVAGALQLSRRTVWVLSFGVAGLLLAALVVFVVHEQNTANDPAPYVNRQAEVTANRESEIVVRQDQAPHVVRGQAGDTPRSDAHLAVLGFMRRQVSAGTIPGPIERSGCHPASGSTASRRAFTCTVTAANVNYPFDAVVAPAQRGVTYCKHDEYAIENMQVPVSPRCLGRPSR